MKFSLKLSLLLLSIGTAACSPQMNFTQLSSQSQLATPAPALPAPPVVPSPELPIPAPETPTNSKVQIFNIGEEYGKADVLFILDTSASMDADLNKLSTKLSQMTSGWKKIDWQIGVTNAGVGSGFWQSRALNGKLMSLQDHPQKSKILKKSSNRPEHYFALTIGRDTLPPSSEGSSDSVCNYPPFCMDFWVKPQPMKAITAAIAEAQKSNKGFFREDAHLIPVIISDADENENGQSINTQPEDVIAYYHQTFKQGAGITGFAFVIQPGDQNCLNNQNNLFQGGLSGRFGTVAHRFTQLTAGKSFSICENDYSTPLRELAEVVRKKIETLTLDSDPIEESVEVFISPEARIPYRIEGRKIIFDRELPINSRIEIHYDSIN